MNKIIDTILERRSIRSFQKKVIPANVLDTIINAANSAPSGAGTQAWRFVVVEKEELRNKLAHLALPKYKKWMESAPQFLKDIRAQIDAHASDPIYYSAPTIIFVIGKGMTADYDCAMVCQNLMLAAKSFDIGSCWVYFGQLVLDEPEIRTLFDIKDGEKVYGPITLGYPTDNQPPRLPKSPPKTLRL